MDIRKHSPRSSLLPQPAMILTEDRKFMNTVLAPMHVAVPIMTPVSMAGFENTIVVEDIVIIHTYNVPMVNAVLEENVME